MLCDAFDWWGLLIGPGRALDSTRYFIFRANVVGSLYGTASPISTNPSTGNPYGPTFPQSTVKDDVQYVRPISSSSPPTLTYARLHKKALGALNIWNVAAMLLGSMTNLE